MWHSSIIQSSCVLLSHNHADGSGTVNFDKDFNYLLEKHVKSVENFGNRSVQGVDVEGVLKGITVIYEHAEVGEKTIGDHYEEPLTIPKVFSNKTGSTKDYDFKPELKMTEGVEKSVTKYNEWSTKGMLSAKYQGSGGQLGFDYRRGRSTTNKQSLATQITDSFEGTISVNHGEECAVSLINELILYRCELQNARWSFRQDTKVECKVYLTNGDKETKKYKLCNVLKERRVDGNEYSFKMNGTYEWVYMQRRIKCESTS